MQQKNWTHILYDGLPKNYGELFLCLPTLCLGIDDVNGSYGSLALLSKMKQCVF
jgi:hypothetical protein